MNFVEVRRNLYIIGIGGVSNGGKTTLCKLLIRRLEAQGIKVKVIHQDEYFKEDNEVPWHESGKFRKWDDLVALNLVKMINDVHSLVGQMQDYEGQSVLLIEGFLIFNHKDLNSFFDKRFFLTLTKEVASERRLLPNLQTDDDNSAIPRRGKAGPKGDRGERGPPGPRGSQIDIPGFEKQILRKMKDLMKNCRAFYMESCFKLIGSLSTKQSKASFQALCEESGGQLANIYNQDHLTDMSRYVRGEVGGVYAQIALGMTYNHQTRSFGLTNGDVKKIQFHWHNTYPKIAADATLSFFSVCTTSTDSTCGIYNHQPYNEIYALCEYSLAD